MVKKTIKKITTKSIKEKTVAEEKPVKIKGCFFCRDKQKPVYTDVATLRRFLSERGKILPKGYTHLCSKHQRAVTKHIKYARHLSLLPFTSKV